MFNLNAISRERQFAVWDSVMKGVENSEEFKPCRPYVFQGVQLRVYRQNFQRAISEGIENHPPSQSVNLKAVFDDYVNMMCKLETTLGKISAFCDSFMDASYLGMPKDGLLKMAKGFHSEMNRDVEACADGLGMLMDSIERNLDAATLFEYAKLKSYNASREVIDSLIKELGFTSIEALHKAEFLPEDLSSSLIPFRCSFEKLNCFAKSLDPEHPRLFMISIYRLAIVVAAYNDEGLLHTYFDRDCAFYQGVRKLAEKL